MRVVQTHKEIEKTAILYYYYGDLKTVVRKDHLKVPPGVEKTEQWVRGRTF